MQLLKKEYLEINFPIFPIPNNIKDENEFEDITYIQGKSWISLQADDCKYIWDFFSVFSNEAFRYYLPAVIYISFEELIKFQKLKDSDLLVDCTCQNMIGRMRDDLDIFRKFSFIQLHVNSLSRSISAPRPHFYIFNARQISLPKIFQIRFLIG